MDDKALEQAIQAKIDEPKTAPPTSGTAAATGAMALAMPGWLKLALGFAVARFGPMAPGAALSGLELAGLPHDVVRDGAENWVALHP